MTSFSQESLVGACCKYARQNIDDDNATSCLELGIKMNLPTIREAALAHMSSRFDVVVKNNQAIGQLSFDAILLMAGHIKVPQPGSEDDVLGIIMKWRDTTNKPDSKQLERMTTQINYKELSDQGKSRFIEMGGTKGHNATKSRMLPLLLIPVGNGCNHYLGGCSKDDSKHLFGYEYKPGEVLTRVEEAIAMPSEDGKPVLFRYFGKSQSTIVAATLHMGPCHCECYEHRRTHPCEIWK